MITPSTLTLAAAKASSILNIAGVCADSAAFLQQLNEATQRLMDYGEWWATVVKARFCIQRNCIAFPRWVGTVLAANVGNDTRPVLNRWYEFMPVTASDCQCATRGHSNTVLVDDGLTPVFNNVPCGSANLIRAYPRFQADLGKTITFYGVDGNGQEIMTRDEALDTWTQGETLTLAAPYAQSAKTYREVTRVQKEATTGPVDVFQYDASQNTDAEHLGLLDMAHYEAGETDPMYRHATLRGGLHCASSRCCSTDGSTARKLHILAKLQFVPVSSDTDVVQIDNVTALKLMIQAIRLEESGDDDGAMKKQALAIKELNRQLRNKLPLDQIPIEVSGSGTALPSYHRIGQIM